MSISKKALGYGIQSSKSDNDVAAKVGFDMDSNIEGQHTKMSHTPLERNVDCVWNVIMVRHKDRDSNIIYSVFVENGLI